ncbi:hypothetical protein [Bradyrhizobium sp. NBAIM08]|uniref:hypothetical protein n=1 Tax=Bradyrhizobium sp. NBAIM08 TaxID=2793815 RepID=UPI001CD26777|nr:hypothetical protein [Bradyrhizobium sp. NBAIM08]MCA1474778.1 hypothetical protein [Bradyrhizobium sp. NBAIM08]
MSNIIDFRSASARLVSCLPPKNLQPYEPRVTRRQQAGRKKNPLRHYHNRAATAVTIAGKLHRGESLRAEGWIDELKWLREGAKAARILADELDGFVARMEAPPAPEPANVRALSPVEFAMAYEQAPPELKRLVCDKIKRLLSRQNEERQQ